MQSAPDKEQTGCKQKGMELNRLLRRRLGCRATQRAVYKCLPQTTTLSLLPLLPTALIFSLEAISLASPHLENATAEFARQNGFSHVKRSTHHVSGEISRATLICSKGYIPSKAKKEGRTEVQLCPFKVAATRCSTTNLLKITSLVNEHNHQPVELTVRFSARNRRLTPADMSDILELRDANIKVADILAVLTNRTSRYIRNRQICNALSGTAQKKIAGMSGCSKLLAFVGSSLDLLGFYSAKEASLEFDTPLKSVFICIN